jgi:fructose-1,6-bisphosphatase/inositol monophosphatase family enzyme
MAAVDADEVARVVRRVGQTVLLPRQAALTAEDIHEKSPGEFVSTVDRQAEAVLTAELLRLLPGSTVVGEEACSADPSLLRGIASQAPVWLVDPLDGTTNYINGSADYAVMVALLVGGEVVGAWISRPAEDLHYAAERGGGAYVGSTPLVRAPAGHDLASLRGAALTRFLDEERQAAVARLAGRVGYLGPGRVCAGVDYPMVAAGEQDFVLFWRTLPWDHAAGALIVTESGGHVAHLDGSTYTVANARPGLLVAADRATHKQIADEFT